MVKSSRPLLLLPWVLALVSVTLSGQTVVEYTLPNSTAKPQMITAGLDGAMWFTEGNVNKIGRITTSGVITEYDIPTAGAWPADIATGSDGAVWFTEGFGNKIGRITASGVVTEYLVPTSGASLCGIAAGPDGALWFTECDGNKIGRITTSGAITEYSLPFSGAYPLSITTGPDGALWFTQTGKIGRITTTGVISNYSIPPSGGADGVGITTGPDGALWFTEPNKDKIGRITTSGTLTEYSIPSISGASPLYITAGPDGALWFTDGFRNRISSITTTGVITDYSIPTSGGEPYSITTASDGSLWFTEYGGHRIGRLSWKLIISTITIPNGTANNTYPTTNIQAPNGSLPYQWSATGLPPGLTLSSSGVLSGTPNTAGTFSPTITATDASTPKQTAQRTYTIGIAATTVIMSNPPGLSVEVDGVVVTTPQSFSWAPGTSHTMVAVSPQGWGSSRLAFVSWGDGGLPSRQVTAGTSNVTYTANYVTQYLLTLSAINGSITSDPASADGYYAEGTSVTLTASAGGSAYVFVNWMGDLMGPVNPQTVMMGRPRSVAAMYTNCTFTLNPVASPLLAAAGASGSFAVTTTAGCLWTATAGAAWISLTPPASGSGSGSVNYTVAANAGIPRGATVLLQSVPFGLTQDSMIPSSIMEYYIPTASAGPFYATKGPDGALWFTELYANKIGRIIPSGAITEYSIPTPDSRPSGITAGSDGALWFTEEGGSKIGRITTSGVITEYSIPASAAVPCSPYGIAAGPDGAMWFTDRNNRIGRIMTFGLATLYSIPTSGASPRDIAAGPDGAMWFTEENAHKIGRITMEGLITEYVVPTSGAAPYGITAGPDGALWFTERDRGKIGRITTSGSFTEYLTPTPGAGPWGITAGPDGALWFAELFWGRIGRITTSGVATEYPIRALPGAPPYAIASGPDGAIWFTETTGNTIGRLSLAPVSIDTASLPNGTLNGAYPATSMHANGIPPYQWAATSLPPGLTLSGDGVLTGIPNTGGTFTPTVTVKDSSTTQQTAQQTYTIVISTTTTITSNPVGLRVTVDGTTVTTPQSFTWTPGTPHSVVVVTPQGSGNTRHVFASWSDGGLASHSITAPTTNSTLIGNYAAQYLLTLSASNGSISASPSSSDGFYPAGTVVSLTAGGAASSYAFSSWSGDLSGSTNPQSVTMAAPQSVTANFASCAITLNPAASPLLAAAGASGSFAVTAAGGCLWTASAGATWISLTPPASGVGNGTVSYTAAANTGPTRLTTVTVQSASFSVTQAPAGPLPVPPSITSLTPYFGSGNQVFTGSFSDPNGWAYIAHARLLLSSAFWPSGGCYADYSPGAGFRLMDDAGSAWLGGNNPSNSSCTLITAGSSASGSGSVLTVSYSLQFSPSFIGRRSVFLYVEDLASAASNPLAMGVWYPLPANASLIKRYRLYDPTSHTHHYTTDCNEYVTLGGRGFVQESADSAVYDSPVAVSGTTAVPFWRIYAAQSASHLWTTDRNEYTTLITSYPGIYVGEGADAFVFPYPSAVLNSMALYRLVWLGAGAPIHHWTTDSYEHGVLSGTGGAWRSEGITAYVFPPVMGAAKNCPAGNTGRIAGPTVLALDRAFGGGQAVAWNEDGTANGVGAAAERGSIVSVTVIEGCTYPVVRIGGLPAEVVGRTGERLEVRVPLEVLPDAAVTLAVQCGEMHSQQGVAVAIK